MIIFISIFLIQKCLSNKKLKGYYHSKPHYEFNPWKFSNHIIKEFNRPPADKIHIFCSDIKDKPKYITKPFRRPKIYGDYFEKNIFK